MNTAHATILPDLLDRHADSTPAAPAVVDDAGTLTYAELHARVLSVASRLQRLGVRPMDRVVLLLPNRAELVIGLFSCFRLGAVAVPLVPGQRRPTWKQVCRDCEPRLVIVETGTFENARRPGPEVTAVDALCLPASEAERAAWPPGAGGRDPLPFPTADDLAALLYTAGAAGLSKGVMHIQGRLARAAARRAQVLGLLREDRFALLIPLSHPMGLMGVLLPAFSVGATLLLPPCEDPGRLATTLAAEAATVALGTPAIYAALARLDSTPAGPLALRRCCAAGSPLPATVARRFRERFRREILQECGMTELPGYCAVPANAANRPGSVGLPAPGVRLRLVRVATSDGGQGAAQEAACRDRSGDARSHPGEAPAPLCQEVAVGEVGEIWIKSDAATVGYWNHPDATAALLCDGWLRTGDLARRDAEGYLYVVGRRGGAIPTR